MASRNALRAIDVCATRIRRGRAAFLVGAGISHRHPSHVPLAGQLSEEILRSLYCCSELLGTIRLPGRRASITEDGFVRLFQGSPHHQIRFESLMQLILDTTGNLRILGVFERKLPNFNHHFLAKTLEAGNQVITTNFDTLIEAALGQSKKMSVVATEKGFQHSLQAIGKKKALFKMHGTLGNDNSLKATIRQVGRSGLAFMWEPAKGRFLERIVRRYHLVFLGYSGTDDLDIMSKLSITKFDKELLWVKHASCEPRCISRREIQSEFNDEVLRDFLKGHEATIIKGNTDTVVEALTARIAGPDTTARKTSSQCKCRHKRSYRSFVRHCVKQWQVRNPGLADFVIARLFYMTGRPKESLTLLTHLEEFFRHTLDYHNYARALLNMAVLEEEMGNYGKAIIHHELTSLLLLAQGDVPTFCDSSRNLATLLMRQRRLDEAESRLKHVVTLSRKLGLKPQYAAACSILASVLRLRGRSSEAKRLLKRAYRKYKGLGDHIGCAAVFCTRGEIAFQEEDMDGAEVLFRMALEEATRLRDGEGCAKLWLNLGAVYTRQGHTKAAQRAYREASQIARQSGLKQYLVVCEIGLCKIALLKGRVDEAIRRSKKWIREAKRIGLHERAAEMKGNIGLALLDKKKYERALAYFRLVKKDYETCVQAPELLAFTYRNIGECLLALHKRGSAEVSIMKAYGLYKQQGLNNQADEASSLLG